jgi:hypothetical protein
VSSMPESPREVSRSTLERLVARALERDNRRTDHISLTNVRKVARDLRSAFRPAVLLSGTLGLAFTAEPAHGQPTARPSVFVREIRVDSILLAFGADSTRIRLAVLDVIRGAGRLATDTTGPALDIDVTVPRSIFGGMFDPRGFVRIEVGRNLVERGRARSVIWQGMVDLPGVPSWREFARMVLPDVIRAVNMYLLSSVRGA